MPEFKVTLTVQVIVDAPDSSEAEVEARMIIAPKSPAVLWALISPNGIDVKPYGYGQERELGRWDDLQ